MVLHNDTFLHVHITCLCTASTTACKQNTVSTSLADTLLLPTPSYYGQWPTPD